MVIKETREIKELKVIKAIKVLQETPDRTVKMAKTEPPD